jgi:hypothetical protein
MLYLAAKPSHVGANVDGLACSLHHPTAYNHQRGGHCCLTGDVLSHRSAVGGGPFPGVRSPRVWTFDMVLNIRLPVRPNIYMEKLAFTRACLSGVRVIIRIMHVSLVELLCQVVMG